jgi:hypothetical protein
LGLCLATVCKPWKNRDCIYPVHCSFSSSSNSLEQSRYLLNMYWVKKWTDGC